MTTRAVTSICTVCNGPITLDRRYTTKAHEGWLHLKREDWVTNVHQAVPENSATELDRDKARDVASSLRALVDPMSGRIDNWSDR